MRVIDGLDALEALAGTELGTSEWLTVTQEMIDRFAEVTLDPQWIHVDRARAAAESPWGTTIAHGFLTLSMLTHLMQSVPVNTPRLEGVIMGINYGLDRVRFISPVSRGKRVRAHAVVKSVELKPASIQTVTTITVEIEDGPRPALVADWVTRTVFDS